MYTTENILIRSWEKDAKSLDDVHAYPLISCNLNTVIQSQWLKNYWSNYFCLEHQCSFYKNVIDENEYFSRILVILL